MSDLRDIRLMVMTHAAFPTEEKARERLWIFLASCKRAGIADVHFCGLGREFYPHNSWKVMQLDWQLEYLKEHQYDYTHVLYSDGGDAVFVGSLEEILSKYKWLGRPSILTAAFEGYGPENQLQESYDWPHPGGYLAEIPAMIQAFEGMLQLPRQTDNNAWHWYDGWKDGSFKATLDKDSIIFKVHHRFMLDERHPSGAIRPRLMVNGSWPCIVHYPGGFQDPVAWKDVMMKDIAERYGLLEELA